MSKFVFNFHLSLCFVIGAALVFIALIMYNFSGLTRKNEKVCGCLLKKHGIKGLELLTSSGVDLLLLDTQVL